MYAFSPNHADRLDGALMGVPVDSRVEGIALSELIATEPEMAAHLWHQVHPATWQQEVTHVLSMEVRQRTLGSYQDLRAIELYDQEEDGPAEARTLQGYAVSVSFLEGLQRAHYRLGEDPGVSSLVAHLYNDRIHMPAEMIQRVERLWEVVMNQQGMAMTA